MKIWVDDVRPAPEGYVWCQSTNHALRTIVANADEVEIIDLDHDAGDFAKVGGDFINVLKELERLCRLGTCELWTARCNNYKFRLHSMNPVGVQNMRAILQKHGWTEIK